MIHRSLGIAALALFAAGCGSSYRYEVVVVNKTDSVISAGLVKRGEGVYQGWDGPEHSAIYAPQLATRHWGTLIKPGASCAFTPAPVPFNSAAYLRVYVGDHSIDQLLGYQHTHPERLDEPIFPGRNVLVISNPTGKLEAQPVSQPAEK